MELPVLLTRLVVFCLEDIIFLYRKIKHDLYRKFDIALDHENFTKK